MRDQGFSFFQDIHLSPFPNFILDADFKHGVTAVEVYFSVAAARGDHSSATIQRQQHSCVHNSLYNNNNNNNNNIINNNA